MGTIVCAVDDSPEAEEARVAVRLSGDAGLRLVVVHVEERADAGSTTELRLSNAAGSCSTDSSPRRG